MIVQLQGYNCDLLLWIMEVTISGDIIDVSGCSRNLCGRLFEILEVGHVRRHVARPHLITTLYGMPRTWFNPIDRPADGSAG